MDLVNELIGVLKIESAKPNRVRLAEFSINTNTREPMHRDDRGEKPGVSYRYEIGNNGLWAIVKAEIRIDYSDIEEQLRDRYVLEELPEQLTANAQLVKHYFQSRAPYSKTIVLVDQSWRTPTDEERLIAIKNLNELIQES